MSAEALCEIREYIGGRLELADGALQIAHDELNIAVDPGAVIGVLTFLRDDIQCQFAALMDISGADYPQNQKRFALCYHLLSPRLNLRLRVKLFVDEDTFVPSVCSVFTGAEWYEREIYDMYGVCFSDHPDMRRLLTDYGFQGHPLRKDFPVSGYVECRYDMQLKKVIYEPVLLQQEMRQFDFLSPWEEARYLLPEDENTAAGEEGAQ